MVLTEGTVLTIILGAIVLAIAAVAMTVNAVFNALNARGDAIMSGVHEIVAKLTSRMDAHEAVVAEQLSSIKDAVAAGAEEHKAWQTALKETNQRVAEQINKSNERIDKLLMHVLDQKE